MAVALLLHAVSIFGTLSCSFTRCKSSYCLANSCVFVFHINNELLPLLHNAFAKIVCAVVIIIIIIIMVVIIGDSAAVVPYY